MVLKNGKNMADTPYNPAEIEVRVQQNWDDSEAFLARGIWVMFAITPLAM